MKSDPRKVLEALNLVRQRQDVRARLIKQTTCKETLNAMQLEANRDLNKNFGSLK